MIQRSRLRILLESDLGLLLGKLHVVEDAEDDPEEVVPPVLLKGVSVTLHDLKHDGEASVQIKNMKRRQDGSNQEQ